MAESADFTKKSKRITTDYVSNSFSVEDFFDTLGCSVIIQHFWPYLSHWEISALVLVCCRISKVITSSSSQNFIFHNLILQKFNRNKNLKTKYGFENPQIKSIDNELFLCYDKDAFAMFMLKAHLRTDGVYSCPHKTEMGPTLNRIFRFHPYDNRLVVTTTTLGARAISPILKHSFLKRGLTKEAEIAREPRLISQQLGQHQLSSSLSSSLSSTSFLNSSVLNQEILFYKTIYLNKNFAIYFACSNPITKKIEKLIGFCLFGKSREIRFVRTRMQYSQITSFLLTRIATVFDHPIPSSLSSFTASPIFHPHELISYHVIGQFIPDHNFPWASIGRTKDDIFD